MTTFDRKKRQKLANLHAHDAVLWVRLCFIIRVETGWENAPISFDRIRILTRDVSLEDLDFTLREMVKVGRLLCSREWSESGRMIETFTNNE